MQVSDEDKKFMEDNRYHYDMAVNAQMVRHLDWQTKQGLVDIIRKYFISSYSCDMWCGHCVMEMLKKCYILYDTWQAKQN